MKLTNFLWLRCLKLFEIGSSTDRVQAMENVQWFQEVQTIVVDILALKFHHLGMVRNKLPCLLFT